MIRNGSKRTLFASGKLELLLMVLESNTKQCASSVTHGIRTRHRAMCQRCYK